MFPLNRKSDLRPDSDGHCTGYKSSKKRDEKSDRITRLDCIKSIIRYGTVKKKLNASTLKIDEIEPYKCPVVVLEMIKTDRM